MACSHCVSRRLMMDLGPYYIPAGRIAGCATVILPAAAIYALYSARKMQLEAPVAMEGRLRVALIAHAAYFSMLPFLFEGGLDVGSAVLDTIGISPGNVPPEPDNLFWQMSNLCGELFFVTAVAYLLMARLSSVPRWTLLVPLSQVAPARTDRTHVGGLASHATCSRRRHRSLLFAQHRLSTISRTTSAGLCCSSTSPRRAHPTSTCWPTFRSYFLFHSYTRRPTLARLARGSCSAMWLCELYNYAGHSGLGMPADCGVPG